MPGDKVRCIQNQAARWGHTGTLVRRYGEVRDGMWAVDWIGPPATKQELQARAQLEAFKSYDRNVDNGLGLEMVKLNRRTTLQRKRKGYRAAVRIQKILRALRARKAMKRLRFRLRYYRRYHMNKQAAWVFMDTEGSLVEKTVRLNQMVPAPRVTFNEAAGIVKYSTDTDTALDTLHGWSGVIAHMQRDAVVLIQKRFRARYARVLRSRELIIRVIGDKMKRMRAQRQEELNLVKGKFLVAKYFLVVLIYSVVAFWTALCILMQLIYGYKFDFQTQMGWIQAYWIAMFLEVVPLSFIKIILGWLLPKYWSLGIIIVFALSVAWFGTQCEEILTDPYHQLLVCETLPF